MRNNHIKAIINQIIISRVAFVSVSIKADVRILNFLTNHITITHNHKDTIGENRNQTSNSQNNAKSTNAVILAKAANQNINHAIIIYFSNSFLSSLDSLH
jgi:hypothetical protein